MTSPTKIVALFADFKADARTSETASTNGPPPREPLAPANPAGATNGTDHGPSPQIQNAKPVWAATNPRVMALVAAARYHGAEIDPASYRRNEKQSSASVASLCQLARQAGLRSRSAKLKWRDLFRLASHGPVVLLLKDGGAGLLAGAGPGRTTVTLRDPLAPASHSGTPVDRMRLERAWAGDAILLRAVRGSAEADAPFTLPWLTALVLQQRRPLRDVAIASLTLSFLTIFPPLLIMTVVDKVLTHHSTSTLVLLATMLGIGVIYETLLGHARRTIVLIVGTRLDTRLALHVFNRLLGLPLDYFEGHPAGETMYKINQIHKVREFLTGKLLTTFLDLMTLLVLLPFLFYLNATLAFLVLGCSLLVALIILAFVRPLRAVYGQLIRAETAKSAALGESIFGIKTVKSLAIEPQQKLLWDERVAEAGKWRLRFGRLASWPQTLITPIERFMSFGVILVGANLALSDPAGYQVGALFAFMMLSMRVAQPLAGLARLIEDYEQFGAAVGEAASVINQPPERDARSGGLRPAFAGAISLEGVSFTYPGTRTPALNRVSLAIPAGAMLGVVGRSGSGKSTLVRLLQGISPDYMGFLRIDGLDLREINLRHLRSSCGVVLQDNFLFRGSIKDNILAGRPGLTLADVVRVARLTGAEEFIERLPNGYGTYIEEGSPNLSGGQKQRLAIARALITDPRILILDEATSALDPESEALVNANLQNIAHGRTTVIVSHRLSSLIKCDQIAVLDEGELLDIAPHRTLLDRCPQYRQLWGQQHRHLDG